MLTYYSFQTRYSHFLTDMIDSTKDMGKGILSMYRRFNHIRIVSFLQPQYQIVGGKGAKSNEGATFLQMLITYLCYGVDEFALNIYI